MTRTSLHDHWAGALNLYYCIFIITYLLVIFVPRVQGCTARPIKSDRMAIWALAELILLLPRLSGLLLSTKGLVSDNCFTSCISCDLWDLNTWVANVLLHLNDFPHWLQQWEIPLICFASTWALIYSLLTYLTAISISPSKVVNHRAYSGVKILIICVNSYFVSSPIFTFHWAGKSINFYQRTCFRHLFYILYIC